jgi:hypothetical protein
MNLLLLAGLPAHGSAAAGAAVDVPADLPQGGGAGGGMGGGDLPEDALPLKEDNPAVHPAAPEQPGRHRPRRHRRGKNRYHAQLPPLPVPSAARES